MPAAQEGRCTHTGRSCGCRGQECTLPLRPPLQQLALVICMARYCCFCVRLRIASLFASAPVQASVRRRIKTQTAGSIWGPIGPRVGRRDDYGHPGDAVARSTSLMMITCSATCNGPATCDARWMGLRRTIERGCRAQTLVAAYCSVPACDNLCVSPAAHQQ